MWRYWLGARGAVRPVPILANQPARWQVWVCLNGLLLGAVHCGLQRCTRLERRSLGCFDLEHSTGSRIAASACCTFAHFEGAKANESDVIAFLESGGNNVNQCGNIAT